MGFMKSRFHYNYEGGFLMKKKKFCAIAMTAAMTLGVVLGNGVSAYAAQEDWIRSGADSEGNVQPSVKYVPYNPPHVTWYEISYGYTVKPGYKYVLRLPDDGYGYKSYDGDLLGSEAGDGYGYRQFQYYSHDDYIGTSSVYTAQYTKDTVEEDFLEYPDIWTLPADKEVKIRVDVADGDNFVNYVFEEGHILVYDQNNTVVDEFDLSSLPVTGVTQPTDAVVPSAPAETGVPAVDTVSAAETAAVSTDAATQGIQSVTAPAGGSVAEVAAEVLGGKWGVGNERRVRLEAAGYDYMEVQKKVAALMK